MKMCLQRNFWYWTIRNVSFAVLLCFTYSCNKEEKVINFEVNECKSLPLVLSDNHVFWNIVTPDYFYGFCCISPFEPTKIATQRELVESGLKELIIWNIANNSSYSIDIGENIIVSEIDWSVNDYLIFSNQFNQIVTVKSDGSDLQVMPIEGTFYHPHWSNDGEKIVTVMFYTYDYPSNRVAIFNKDGSNFSLYKFEESVNNARFLADDKSIIFKDYQNGFGVSVYNLETEEIVFYPKIDTTTSTLYYDVSPNGKSIIICETYGFMYSVDLETKQHTVLRQSCSSKIYSCPSISNDGKQLLITRRHTQLLNETTQAIENHPYLINLETDYEERLKLD